MDNYFDTRHSLATTRILLYHRFPNQGYKKNIFNKLDGLSDEYLVGG